METRPFLLCLLCTAAGIVLFIAGAVLFDPGSAGMSLAGLATFWLPVVLMLAGAVTVYFAYRLLQVAMLGYTVIVFGMAVLTFGPPSFRPVIWTIVSGLVRWGLDRLSPAGAPPPDTAFLDRLEGILTEYGILGSANPVHDVLFVLAGVAVIAIGAWIAMPRYTVRFEENDRLGNRRTVTIEGRGQAVPRQVIERRLSDPPDASGGDRPVPAKPGQDDKGG
jgi:hypothetical protein